MPHTFISSRMYQKWSGDVQPFDCLVNQNHQPMCSTGRSMDWTVKDNMINGLFLWATLTSRRRGHTQECSGAGTRGNGVPTPFSRFVIKWVWSCFKMAILGGVPTPFFSSTSLAIFRLCKQKRKRPTPVRRRLSRTHHAVLAGLFQEWVPMSGMKVRSLVVLSNHSAFHRWSAKSAALLLLSSDEQMSCCVRRVQMGASIWDTVHSYRVSTGECWVEQMSRLHGTAC